MAWYYCNGKRGLCDADESDCDGCIHWDGTGVEFIEVEDSHPIRGKIIFYLKRPFKALWKVIRGKK